MINKAVIGIILDRQESGSFSEFEYFALRTHYSEAIKLAGGLPLMIPYIENNLIDQYLNKIDGLLVPGGFYSTPDSWYLDPKKTSPYQETPRFACESQIILKAIELNKPLLGICAGMQVLAGLMGCKLIPNIKEDIGTKIEHFDFNKDHNIKIEKDSILYKIIGKSKILTNSHHNEAVISVTDQIKISAKSLDGVIEAIEMKDKKFILGLQWHPEMLCHKKKDLQNFNPHHLIFKEFINAASH